MGKIKRSILLLLFVLKLLCFVTIHNRKKSLFLFGVPSHSNLGDQTQTLCIRKWFAVNYPDYTVFEFPQDKSGLLIVKLLRLLICKNDKVVCHSGYHLTDMYPIQDIYCNVVETFYDRPILIFPQTIFYKSSIELEKTASIMNAHGGVTLLVRDAQSYETAKTYFSSCKLILFPDIVTSLIGTRVFSKERDGILFCTRNDIEAFYSPNQLQELKDRFSDIKVEQTDTTLSLSPRYIIRNRDKVLTETLDYFASFNLVITDRYHGTILSLVAGTPVVVLKTSDHKLSSGVDWFPDEFREYICFANNLTEAYTVAQEMLKRKLSHRLPAYFKTNYYDKLKSILEGKYDQTV